ncbi:MAG TPA: hypothetical protein VH134_01625 [Candidatus Dormibacteraeota bacterium]|nr:hypothetical protein [Candidatus Dormibacteraeota bacterium]
MSAVPLLAALVLLGGCGTPPSTTASIAPDVGLPGTSGLVPDLATAPAAPPPDVASVAVRPFREPNDHAHRNYCGAGATEVLLSAFLAQTPDVETVARTAGLDPNSGETGAQAVAAINRLLAGTVQPLLGHDLYRGVHATDVSTVEEAIRSDLSDPVALTLLGHGSPVMVQTMTRTMPGWSGWNATHMITIFAADLSHGDPALDTVTYMETPSTVAGYSGPPSRTLSVAALWTAMRQFLTDAPSDPVNLIF